MDKKDIVVDNFGNHFENKIALHICSMNIELLNNIRTQLNLLIELIYLLKNSEYQNVSYKKQKRIESLYAWSNELLENIIKFTMRCDINGFSTSILKKYNTKDQKTITVKEAKKIFDVIIKFTMEEIEIEENFTK